MTKELFSNVEEIKEKLSRVVTPEMFDKLSEELRAAEKSAQLEINRKNADKEEREKKAFEKAKAQHMATIAKYEALCEELKIDEHDLVRECMEFVAATKERADSLAAGMILADTINQNRVKFGTEEVRRPQIYMYQSPTNDWEGLARGILERVLDLIRWNTNHDDHVQPFTLHALQNPNTWGVTTTNDEEV